MVDPSTFANTQCFLQKSISMEFTPDFDRKVLKSSATIVFEVLSGEDTLILDSRHLSIQSIADAESSQPLNFTLGEAHAVFGAALSITVPKKAAGSTLSIKITYETSPKAEALQWLEPAQTAMKTHPYLFSQCQAIHARSMLPCQDTPSAKFSYTAKVTPPEGLVALMSAVEVRVENGSHYWEQKVPVPSYLVAICVGLLESRDLGPRSRVWSEKSVIDAAAYELASTDAYLRAGEELLTPYAWGRYDVLILPPSFPYGGMENPCLTFVTPTILAGDRSLTNVIAHEISHSWTGNLVTNVSWEHFWLNEGFTMFVQRKILERVSGRDCAQMSALMGQHDLRDTVAKLGADHPYTKLHIDLRGVDPDDAFSRIPYEKGFNFLSYLEELVGGPSAFEPFLKAYIVEFTYKTVSSDDFRSYFQKHFNHAVDWDAWLLGTGLPPVLPAFDRSMADSATSLAERWIEAADNTTDDFYVFDQQGWQSAQTVLFLQTLVQNASKVTAKMVQRLDAIYQHSESQNAEVMFNWQMLCLKAGAEFIVPAVIENITTNGRMKFVRPLYCTLHSSSIPGAKQLAEETFRKNRPRYHPITAKMVSSDLKIQ